MSEEVIEKPRREHVLLSETSAQKINKWFEQINAKKKIRITRKDLVNWLIERLPENLSGGDLNALIERFYDEEKFLRQLLREVRDNKANGNGESLDLIVRPKKTDPAKDTNASD